MSKTDVVQIIFGIVVLVVVTTSAAYTMGDARASRRAKLEAASERAAARADSICIVSPGIICPCCGCRVEVRR